MLTSPQRPPAEDMGLDNSEALSIARNEIRTLKLEIVTRFGTGEWRDDVAGLEVELRKTRADLLTAASERLALQSELEEAFLAIERSKPCVVEKCFVASQTDFVPISDIPDPLLAVLQHDKSELTWRYEIALAELDLLKSSRAVEPSLKPAQVVAPEKVAVTEPIKLLQSENVILAVKLDAAMMAIESLKASQKWVRVPASTDLQKEKDDLAVALENAKKEIERLHVPAVQKVVHVRAVITDVPVVVKYAVDEAAVKEKAENVAATAVTAVATHGAVHVPPASSVELQRQFQSEIERFTTEAKHENEQLTLELEAAKKEIERLRAMQSPHVGSVPSRSRTPPRSPLPIARPIPSHVSSQSSPRLPVSPPRPPRSSVEDDMRVLERYSRVLQGNPRIVSPPQPRGMGRRSWDIT